jgi:hypothetical protein
MEEGGTEEGGRREEGGRKEGGRREEGGRKEGGRRYGYLLNDGLQIHTVGSRSVFTVVGKNIRGKYIAVHF